MGGRRQRRRRVFPLLSLALVPAPSLNAGRMCLGVEDFSFVFLGGEGRGATDATQTARYGFVRGVQRAIIGRVITFGFLVDRPESHPF